MLTPCCSRLWFRGGRRATVSKTMTQHTPSDSLTDMGSYPTQSPKTRGRRCNNSLLRIYLLGLLLLLLQASVEAEQVLIWSQHSHLWTKLRGIYGQTDQWLPDVQQRRQNFMTSESTRDQILDSLAYDHKTAYVYWHDQKTRTFYRQRADDSLIRRSTATEKVYEGTSGQIGGMDIDWVTGNVFWTDRQLKQIRMTKKHPTSTDLVRVVAQGLLGDPTNIAVDPLRVRLYWGEQGTNPRIMTSDMEGGDMRPLTQPGAVSSVRSLTLDLSDEIIYFVDEDPSLVNKPKVKKLDLRTFTLSDAIMVLNGQNYPGIASHKNYIYLLDGDYLEVQVYSKTAGTLTYRYVIDAFPHDIVISDTLDPRWDPPTRCNELDCGDFCVRLSTGQEECRCRDKYYFRLDKKSCISSIPRFIYGMDGHLWDATADISSEENRAELIPKLLTPQQYGVIEAVGYHFTKDLVFFSDTRSNDIFRLEVEKRRFLQITANEYRVEGITVCWMSETLYWTDSELGHVMMSKLDGRYHRQLLSNLGQPKGITCDAIHGYLFFALGQNIEKMFTDGTNREMIVKNVPAPQSVVVDPRSEKIYWTQASNELYTSDLDGNNKGMVMQAGTSQPYGITLFQDYVVWTQDDLHPKIGSKVNRLQVNVQLQTPSPNYNGFKTRDIVTFDHFLQPGTLGPCVGNGGCQQLCFVTPQGERCGCAIGYTLGDDGKKCTTVTAETQFVLFVDPFHKAIYQHDVRGGKTHAIPMNQLDFPVSMDIEPRTGKVIYIDQMKGAIRSSYTNGVDDKELWKYPQDRKPTKVAYNPENEVIYFTDQGVGSGGVYSLPKDGGQPKVIVQNLIKPSGVAVDGIRGMVYYAEMGTRGGQARIGAVKVDGTEHKTVADTVVNDPSDLTLLTDENLLFWSDKSYSEVWMYNLTTGQSRMLLKDSTGKQFLSISADSNQVFLSVYGNKSVFSMDWREPAPQLRSVNDAIFARIYDIKAYPDIALIPPPLAPVVGTAVPFMWIGVGIAAAVLLGLLLLLALCFARKKPKPKKKAPKGSGAPVPPPVVVGGGGSDDVEWADVGLTNAMMHDNHVNGGMSNGYHNPPEPDYQNFANGHPADIPVTESAPQLNGNSRHHQNGFEPQNLASAAMVVASTGQLRKTDHYKKNPQAPPVPVAPSFETNQKMSTMVERLAKRLRTGISSIRWTNGERDRDSRGSQPPDDMENPGDPDADQVGAHKQKYAKRPPIGPFKPQLHRLPQGFAPASRVVPSAVKATWGRNKKGKGGRPQLERPQE